MKSSMAKAKKNGLMEQSSKANTRMVKKKASVNSIGQKMVQYMKVSSKTTL